MLKKKKYISPEFEEIKIRFSNQLLNVSAEKVMHDGDGGVPDWED